MTKHKWYKEIVAWAGGAEIEWRWQDQYKKQWSEWENCNEPKFYYFNYEFRIKPQPVAPQYLYVYKDCPIFTSLKYLKNYKDYYVGKIPLIVESNDD